VQRTYFHRAWQHLAVVEIVVDNTGSGDPIELQLDDDFSMESEDIDFRIVSEDKHTTCIEGQTREAEVAGEPAVGIAMCRSRPPASMTVPAYSTTSLILPSTVWTTLDPLPGPSVRQVVRAQHDLVRSMPEDDLQQLHVTAMQELGETGIEVEGNVELSKLINVSLWSIRASIREDRGMPISPGGLVGDCYGGHTFWDAEQFIWPNLLMFHPGMAKDSLQYRFHRRHAAEDNAILAGKAGMKFPWESAASGQEVSPWDQAAKEVHISADVSFAFWKYWQSSGDEQWLTDVGWPVLQGVAQYFASVSVDADGDTGGKISIKDVMDVDEAADLVTNSAYTNAVAKLALHHAMKASELIGKPDAVGSNWTDILRELPVLFNEGTHLHSEYESSDDLGTGLGVIMLQYPLDVPTIWPSDREHEVRRNDLIHYASQQVGDSTMYWWAVVIAWLSLGEVAPASAVVTRLSEAAHGPFRTWVEGNVGGAGCHNFVTAAGGYLQVLWAGYAGVRLTDDALTFHAPQVPPDTSKLVLRGLAYRGSQLKVSITEGTINLVLMSSGQDAAPLLVSHSTAAAWIQLEEGKDNAFPAGGTVRVIAAKQRCEFVAGEGGSNECPGGSAPLSEAECRALPAHFAGTSLHDPFVGDNPGDPRGCFRFGAVVFYNAHPSGSPVALHTPCCKACEVSTSMEVGGEYQGSVVKK